MKKILNKQVRCLTHNLPQLSGNIHCLTDPNEAVIGYVEITQEQTQRIFIFNSQVSGWNYNPGCSQL